MPVRYTGIGIQCQPLNLIWWHCSQKSLWALKFDDLWSPESSYAVSLQPHVSGGNFMQSFFQLGLNLGYCYSCYCPLI